MRSATNPLSSPTNAMPNRCSDTKVPSGSFVQTTKLKPALLIGERALAVRPVACAKLVHQGMLGINYRCCFARGVVAAWLALLLSFASLAPLAAQSLIGLGSSCCRNRVKCCCRKANATQPQGPALSGTSCGSDCGQLTMAHGNSTGFAPPSSLPVARPIVLLAMVRAGQRARASHLPNHALRQRPPPPASLA